MSLWARRKIKKIERQSKILLHKSANQIRSREENQSIEYWQTGLLKLKKMASYALYTRLFSLWHVFHLPIFFMMVIAATVHIFVVHMY